MPTPEGRPKKAKAAQERTAAPTSREVADELLGMARNGGPCGDGDKDVESAVKRLLGARSRSPHFSSVEGAVEFYKFLSRVGILGLSTEDVAELSKLSSHVSKIPDANAANVMVCSRPIKAEDLDDLARFGVVGSHNVFGGIRFSSPGNKGHARTLAMSKEILVSGERFSPFESLLDDTVAACGGPVAKACLADGVDLTEFRDALTSSISARDRLLAPSPLLKSVLEPGETREKALVASAAVISRLSEEYGLAYETKSGQVDGSEPGRRVAHPKATFGTIGCGGANSVNCGSLVGNIGGQVKTLRARLPRSMAGEGASAERDSGRRLSRLLAACSERRTLVEYWRFRELRFDDFWKQSTLGKTVTQDAAREFSAASAELVEKALGGLVDGLPLVRGRGLTEGDLVACALGAVEASYLAGSSPCVGAEALAADIARRVAADARRRGETVFSSLVERLETTIKMVLEEAETP